MRSGGARKANTAFPFGRGVRRQEVHTAGGKSRYLQFAAKLSSSTRCTSVDTAQHVRRRSALATPTSGMQVGRGGVHAHGSLRIGVHVRRDSTRSSQIAGHRSGSPLKPATRSLDRGPEGRLLIGYCPSGHLPFHPRSRTPARQFKRCPDRSLHAGGLLAGGDRQSLCSDAARDSPSVAREHTTDRPSHPAVTSCCLACQFVSSSCLSAFQLSLPLFLLHLSPRIPHSNLSCDTICCQTKRIFFRCPPHPGIPTHHA